MKCAAFIHEVTDDYGLRWWVECQHEDCGRCNLEKDHEGAHKPDLTPRAWRKP